MCAAENKVKIRAYSPGKYPILVVEIPDVGLRTVYYETDYDLGSAKTVGERLVRAAGLSSSVSGYGI